MKAYFEINCCQQEIQTAVGIKDILFENEYRFTKKQLVDFFEVSERTFQYYIEKYKVELAKNGYEVLVGKKLKTFKLAIHNLDDNAKDFGIKTSRLGVFNFRAFLNLGILLTDSLKACELRSAILDIIN